MNTETTFYDEISRYQGLDFNSFFERVSEAGIASAISRPPALKPEDLLALLSPKASSHLEEMAQTARRLTQQHFGPNILLFTPLYLGNYCVNHCVYCGFSASNTLPRRCLTPEEVEAEGKVIAQTGLKHLLILTGESRQYTPVSYIADCVRILRKYFSSVSIEIYPLSKDEYAALVKAGVDGLTIYQEVYNPEMYLEVHPKGPKRDYRFRLEAPERACQAGVRTVNIGPLMGLHEWRSEVFFAGIHAAYLQHKFPEVEVSLSLPRMRPQLGGYQPKIEVTDKELVQSILALRLFLPRSGITLSTRERPELRDNLIKLGITKMSAGTSTAVGGHTDAADAVGQFEISDERSVEEMRRKIASLGYKAVLKDWHDLGEGGRANEPAAKTAAGN